MKNIEVGDPVILVNAEGLEEYHLHKDQKGTANSLVNVDGQDLLMFMINEKCKMYWLAENRFVIDEEALAALEAEDE